VLQGAARIYVVSLSRGPRRADAFASFLEKNNTSRVVMFFFFQKKKQKASFRFADIWLFKLYAVTD
jgi:hypothetical protein